MRILIALVLCLAGVGGLASASMDATDAPVLSSLTVSVQDSAGRVWGVGRDARFRETLVCWDRGAWRTVVADIDWPGSSWAEWRDEQGRFRPVSSHGPRSGVIALTVGPDGAVWSWWEAKHDVNPEPAEENPAEPDASAYPRPTRLESRLHAYRHSLEKPWEPMGSWLRVGARPPFSRRRGGPARDWEAMPIRRLFHTGAKLWALCADDQRADGAVLWELDQGSGAAAGIAHPLPIPEGSAFATPRLAVDAWGRVWVWAERLENLGPGAAARLFLRFEEGEFDAAPGVAGLPAGEITAFALDTSGRSAIAAVRGAGLWRIDLEALRAESRSSPPLGIGRVWALQTWPDGLEVALAGGMDEARWESHVNHWGHLWLRAPGDGAWRERGMVRVENWQGSALRPMPMRELRWHRHEGHLLLTGARRVWAWALDAEDADAGPRLLDWTIGCETWSAGAAYPLGDDGLLLASWSELGSEAVRLLAPGRLPGLMRRAPSSIRRIGDATASVDGAIWTEAATGPRERELRRWKDGVWRRWAQPGDEGAGREFAVDTLGRAWIYSTPDAPAWVLAPESPEAGWARHESLRRLIVETVATRPELRLLPTRRSEGLRLPVWNASGSALVWEKGNEFHLWRKGRWTPLAGPSASAMHGPVAMGLEGEGGPWVASSLSSERDRRWRLATDGRWEAAGELKSRYARHIAEEAARPVAPAWFAEAPEIKAAGSLLAPVVDSTGAWWCFAPNRPPLRGRDGRIWPAIRDEVPDPWRAGLNIYTVQRIDIGADGTARIWSFDTVTIIPPDALGEPPPAATAEPVSIKVGVEKRPGDALLGGL